MGKILKVNSKDKIPALEKLLVSANIKIIAILRPTCGPCQRFKENIWNPSLKSKAKHDRIEILDSVFPSTSLSNTNVEVLPSIIVVDEKGKVQNTISPEGEETPIMPTPTNVKDMVKMANVTVKPSSPNANTKNVVTPENAQYVLNTPQTSQEISQELATLKNKVFTPAKGGTRRKSKIGPKRRTRK